MRGFLDQHSEAAAAGKPLPIPPEPRQGHLTVNALNQHLNLASHAKLGPKTIVERWLDAVTVADSEPALEKEPSNTTNITRHSTLPGTSSSSYVKLQLTSAANDTLDLALAVSEDHSITIGVDESYKSVSEPEDNGTNAQAQHLNHSRNRGSSATGHTLVSGVPSTQIKPSKEAPSISSRSSCILFLPTAPENPQSGSNAPSADTLFRDESGKPPESVLGVLCGFTEEEWQDRQRQMMQTRIERQAQDESLGTQ
ncbi:hypothetical protein BU25DRAFT_91290 [Macroventuria anomochaeta]|uniref:Uncharacterized protein n=1 Tax=Macroventuria anomochaeta TaxID=301207 RepID=A0ACB6RY00_9PLEO|nr:uncharacterized protein BU25DRAFT_91290 [Macroventuria anomochaeta]KAF2626582.1 hypothetical protein BU25DRAFT_91290 [Macroventuria anomochaeta]